MPNYSNPKSPRLGDAYNSKDSITGAHDKTSQELAERTAIENINVYSSINAGSTVHTSRKGAFFAVGTSLVFYKADGTAVSITP